jgi:hypothetical protein
MNSHLDRCLLADQKKESLRCSRMVKRKPIAKLVYNLLSDKELKKKLNDVGLPALGDRKALIACHREYTLRYNSECDAVNPKSGKEIIRDMLAAENDRQQQTTKSTVNTMSKIDKGASAGEIESFQKDYVKQHKSQFSELIAAIRQSRQGGSKPAAASTVSGEDDDFFASSALDHSVVPTAKVNQTDQLQVSTVGNKSSLSQPSSAATRKETDRIKTNNCDVKHNQDDAEEDCIADSDDDFIPFSPRSKLFSGEITHQHRSKLKDAKNQNSSGDHSGDGDLFHQPSNMPPISDNSDINENLQPKESGNESYSSIQLNNESLLTKKVIDRAPVLLHDNEIIETVVDNEATKDEFPLADIKQNHSRRSVVRRKTPVVDSLTSDSLLDDSEEAKSTTTRKSLRETKKRSRANVEEDFADCLSTDVAQDTVPAHIEVIVKVAKQDCETEVQSGLSGIRKSKRKVRM